MVIDNNYFDCEKLSARLSKATCAQKYKAQIQYSICTTCPLGAIHAGAKKQSEISSHVCTRCNKQASRMVRGAICVSCYNREREFIKGRNAKGEFPVMAKKVQKVKAEYAENGKIKVIEAIVANRVELSLLVLKFHPESLLIPNVPKGNVKIFQLYG